MSDSDEDTHNQGQEEQTSKLPKPASINNYFGKIEGNPKLWQFEAKIKPNPSDKYTKMTFKTNNKRFLDWGWVNNSKMKFETKEGKTKLSISSKMLDNTKRSSKQKQGSEEISMRHSSEKQKQPKSKDESNRSKDNGDIEVSFSTSYDDSKLNIKVKDRDEINVKFNQAISLIPNTLTSNLEYIWEYKNKTDTQKYSAELMYTTGLSKWIYERALPIFRSSDSPATTQPSLGYHKNETKMKAKISNHSDTQFKVTSINHFGEINQKSAQPVKQKQKTSEQISEEIDQSNSQQNTQSSEKQAQTQNLKTKVELENKITIFKKQSDGFNFKTSLNCEQIDLKQSFKLQTIINHSGLHNVQARYICKRWQSFIFGAMVGMNWNTHNSQWHKKWQAIVQKKQFLNLGNVAMSLSEKYAGIRVMKKLTKNSKIEIMASRKWNLGTKDLPNIGIKINMNW